VHAIKLLKAKADAVNWDIAVLYPLLEGSELFLDNVVKEPVLIEGQVSVSAVLHHDVLCMIERRVNEEAWLGPVIRDKKSIVVRNVHTQSGSVSLECSLQDKSNVHFTGINLDSM